MAFDIPLELMQATVQLEQYGDGGVRWVGTGFLIASPATKDEPPGVILVTANHVLAGMAAPTMQVGYRSAGPEGGWRYTPAPVQIRAEDGAPLWTRHPTSDVAAIRIEAPPQFARAAIPLNYLAGARGQADLEPGQELMALGFPKGLAANSAGFPILRSGRVASYPASPRVSPTFMLDFTVFPGNSGGPVFNSVRPPAGQGAARPVIAGILTQQVELNGEKLGIGLVTHARYVAETVALLEPGAIPEEVEAPPPTVQEVAEAPVPGAKAASEVTKPRPSALGAALLALQHAFFSVAKALSGLFSVLVRV